MTPLDRCPPTGRPTGRRLRRGAAAGTALAALLALSGCGLGAPPVVESAGAARKGVAATAPDDGEPAVSVLASRLRVPWGIDFLPDGGALVTERDSRRLLRVGPASDSGGLTVTPIQTITEADANGEGGLLGLAVSPRYATDRTVFLYYTTGQDNRIAKLTLGGRPTPIVTGIPISGIHNGGRLGFGPDGFLYASTGDASRTGNSQDLKSLGGKVLRMTPEGRPAPGNPFPDSLVWSYGHRNVQGFAWDSAGRMFATEFGQNTWDELNRIEPGKNYGWPIVEGKGSDPRYVDPLVVWTTAESSCSGAAIIGDTFHAACLRGTRVWAVKLGADGGVVGEPVASLRTFGRLRTAVKAPDGSLWVSTSNHDGRGNPVADDDRIVRVSSAGTETGRR
ncbi:oxidoreductase [Pilimelia terevasa]|uniref:Oxidoreductase n=1 Tax=Pilimelia terevasa TaxID=53372 RepID=A0A8J3BJK9_9ACTN|nr:PQQ-dependent sugar dehydrogenase [Pilimelia terevasa]GGK19474.1 oxidoreductase [Pilimelia terevasa]